MSKRTDISQQIRKYLNGELDARAMHQLEKEAQNDPFLMEALEGYEKTVTDQQNNIDDIQARLAARVNKKEARIIPWRMIAIAASILIILGIGGLWLKNEPVEKAPKQIALVNTTKPVKPETKPITVAKPTEMAKMSPPVQKAPAPVLRSLPQIKQSEAVVASAPSSAEYKAVAPPAANGYLANETRSNADEIFKLKDTSNLNEVVVLGYAKQKKLALAGSIANIKPADLEKKDKSQTIVTQLEGKAARVELTSAPGNAITGVVTGRDDGLPIPGVTVQVKGTTIGVVTDAAGRFKLKSVPNGAVLNFKFIGYTNQDVAVTTKRDSLIIAMQPAQNALAEVVTTAYSVSKQQEYLAARPANGWDDYNKYLKDNALSPDGKTGTVKLSFIVNTDNSLSDFKIIKSVSAKTDSAAIALIQKGPDWYRNTDSKPEKVKIRVKFKIVK